MRNNLSLVLGLVCLGWSVASTRAAEISVRVTEKEPPKELGESIGAVLQPKSIQLLEGEKPVYEFWFRKEVPLQAKPESPEKSLQSIGEVTLIGAVSVGENRRDYKDNEIHPGIYTVRFGLQPQDGDHLGTAEYPYFAVLVPAKADSDLEGIKKYRPMVRASAKATTAGHPAVLSLRPASNQAKNAPTLTEPAPEHKAIQVQLPAKAPDSNQTVTIVFELVVQGRYKS